MNEIELAIEYLQNPTGKGVEAHAEFELVALAALCEQAERSKGCVWCKSDSQVTHNGEHFCFFCSYCGKRLEVEP